MSEPSLKIIVNSLGRSKLLLVILYFTFLFNDTDAQILKNESTLSLIDEGVHAVYNHEFTKARDVQSKISGLYPNHPITFLLKGLITYWDNYPLLPESPAKKYFESDMLKCIELSDNLLYESDEAEYLMSTLAARGMLLLFYADNGLSMSVIPLATGTYKYVKQSFDYTGTYADFYFFTGLYNYYREAYPEAHPIYKPLTFLFPKGDKERGLSELNTSAQKALFIKAEANTFLSGIYISFENKFDQALKYSKVLYDLYPGNIQYLASYIKNLLLVKRYDETESLINSTRRTTHNVYYQAQIQVFLGILYEKHYRSLSMAKNYYLNGIHGTVSFGSFASEYTAYAYFGLSRISEREGDRRNARSYRNNANSLAAYKNVTFDN